MCTDVVVDVEGHGWKWMDDRIGYGIGLDVELDDWIGLDVELDLMGLNWMWNWIGLDWIGFGKYWIPVPSPIQTTIHIPIPIPNLIPIHIPIHIPIAIQSNSNLIHINSTSNSKLDWIGFLFRFLFRFLHLE
jgi:hypothetical protein